MHSDMLHLAERLVIAIETISQDVKNMSAYVYDLSCSVSYLLNEKREKESIPVVAGDEGDNPQSVASGAGQETSADIEYSGQYEQTDERSLWYIGDPEHGDSSFGDTASMSTDANENAGALSSENNPTFTERIKMEELSEDEVNDESCEMHDVYGNSGATDRDYAAHRTRILDEPASAHQMETAMAASVVHTRVDIEEGLYKCTMCGKSFKSRLQLKVHTRVHTGEKPYKCNVCGRAFSHGSNLTLHIRCHTGERPYKCNVCRKAFSQSSKLTLHMRIHTGEKPYQCTLCGNAFSQKVTLRNHMLTHTGEKPHKCTLCGKAFRFRSAISKHMYSHSAELPSQ